MQLISILYILYYPPPHGGLPFSQCSYHSLLSHPVRTILQLFSLARLSLSPLLFLDLSI